MIRLNSNSFNAYYFYSRISFAPGHIEKSAELFRKASETRQEDYQSLLLLEIGEHKEAFEWIDKARSLYPHDAGVLINAVGLYAKDNQKEKALDLLEEAVEKGFGKKEWIEHDPDYDSLRNEPRFKALLSNMK